MRLFRASFRDRKGVQQKSRKWYVEFKDHNDIVRRIPAFGSKPASEEFGRNLDKLVSYHRATGGQTDPSLQTWITQLPQRTRDKLVEIGLIDGERVAVTKKLSKHLDDFRAALKAKGCSARHVELVLARARKVFEGCGFDHYGQISASRVSTYLHGLNAAEDGISAQTHNFYLQSAKQFCRWMVKDRRASTSPLAHLQGLNVRTDRRHDRRALSLDELCRLLDVTHAGPERFKMSGPERSLLYRLAVETGLRAGELRSLSPASFRFGKNPVVTVAAGYSKNRRESVLPLRSVTATLLAHHLKARNADGYAFTVPPRQHVAKMIKADLEAARAKWLEEAKDDSKLHEERHKSDFLAYSDANNRKADFHSLRHTFITNLASAGVHPKTAQMLARHSTFALTMERYSHVEKQQESSAIETLPTLPLPPENKITSEKSADNPDDVLADCLAEIGTRDETSGDSERLVTKKEASAQAEASQENTAILSGEGEIRTPATLAGRPVFETGAFNHSATSPGFLRNHSRRRRFSQNPRFISGFCNFRRLVRIVNPPRLQSTA